MSNCPPTAKTATAHIHQHTVSSQLMKRKFGPTSAAAKLTGHTATSLNYPKAHRHTHSHSRENGWTTRKERMAEWATDEWLEKWRTSPVDGWASPTTTRTETAATLQRGEQKLAPFCVCEQPPFCLFHFLFFLMQARFWCSIAMYMQQQSHAFIISIGQ